MPLVSLSIAKGESSEFLSKLMSVTMSSLQQALQLPDDDRNIRIMEYEPYLFTMKKPYKLIIEISMFSGRTVVTKKLLYQLIVTNLSESLGIAKNEIFILINEQPKENWGVRGGIPANEIELGFKVDI
ncbi:MAG TPA: tautomerase family protein [Tenuifilaceae bacterium]|nr:tautomerase family protein [Tenuifilaceae bacterium]HPI46194.1 tautomerase family protein [Tenuifilaceae bacterium]HPN22798.1 tautomerase family protein [Tenuifilaceae bacterium]